VTKQTKQADHVQAKALVGKLMGSRRSDDRVRLVAQARLIDAYERSRWPRSVPTLPDLLNYLMGQYDLSRSDLTVMAAASAGQVVVNSLNNNGGI
jgi:HTH-type transcriptional regulator/antitoxin HigA